MARSIDRIERDIAKLQKASKDLAERFDGAYRDYLAVLGQAMRQQLILATYHICTQGYPENFLGLSFSRKQQLQEKLRQIGNRGQEELGNLLEQVCAEEETAKAENFPSESEEIEMGEQGETEETESEEIEMGEQIESESEESEAIAVTDSKAIEDPERLDQWLVKVESAIVRVLQQVSRQTNRLLHQEGILSQDLPEMFLEAAAKVPNSDAAMAGPPNVIDMTIQTETPEDLQGIKGLAALAKGPIHIMAIHMRLSDIEFADPKLSTLRGELRKLSSGLNSLKRDYQQTQRELVVAQAEGAWRASWAGKINL